MSPFYLLFGREAILPHSVESRLAAFTESSPAEDEMLDHRLSELEVSYAARLRVIEEQLALH